MRILLILLLAVLETAAVEYLYNNPTYYHLDDHTWESDDFRAMRLGEYAAGLETLDPDQLAAWMAEMEYDLMINPGSEACERPCLAACINDSSRHDLLKKIRVNGSRAGER